MAWHKHRGFTLVEILIVVVILGILAVVVTALFVNTTHEAAINTTYSELQKLRRHIGVYQARNGGSLPQVAAGNGTWGELVGADYLSEAPTNAWVGGSNSRVIVLGNAADASYQSTHGWIFDPASGAVLAGAFDANDDPLAQP